MVLHKTKCTFSSTATSWRNTTCNQNNICRKHKALLCFSSDSCTFTSGSSKHRKIICCSPGSGARSACGRKTEPFDSACPAMICIVFKRSLAEYTSLYVSTCQLPKDVCKWTKSNRSESSHLNRDSPQRIPEIVFKKQNLSLNEDTINTGSDERDECF
jgi:hypothetical protein